MTRPCARESLFMRKDIPAALSFWLLLALSITLLAQEPTRPQHWARPIALDGVPNLHQVAEGIYRSAQPTAAGLRQLQALGVQRTLSLRHDPDEESLAAGLGMTLLHIRMSAWYIRDQEVIAALKLLLDARQAPILIHCRHGADRTGVVCAAYRIVCQNWSTGDAIAEMVEGGFGYHQIFHNIRNYLENLKVEEIRTELAEENPLE